MTTMTLRALGMTLAMVVLSVPARTQERRVIGGQPQAAFPPPPISSSQSIAEMTTVLDGYLAKLAAEDGFSGVMLLAKDGKAVFEKAYGFADRANRSPNTTATRFNIASVGKQFTIAAIELLKSQGKLKAEDTVGALLPGYPNEQAKKATVQQLVDHRGGIPDFFGPEFSALSPSKFRSNADYFAFVAPRPLDFEPGAERRYCNGCYIVLGEIIAKVSGIPYERYVEEKIFAPRGMKNTGWPQSDALVPGLATGHTRRLPESEGQWRANTYTHGAAGCAAGGAYATASDLLAFFKNGPTGSPQAGDVGMGVAGGAPGANAVVTSRGPWIAIALSNLDPPAASVASAIVKALQ